MDPDAGDAPLGQLVDLPKAPDGIELRHLRSFVAVAEELNFSRAAERLFVTQPALSRQIRGLERVIGVELLTRSTHRVELTVAGEALLSRTRPMLTDLDEAVVRTRSIGGGDEERVARLTQPVIDNLMLGLDAYREAVEAMHAQFPVPDGLTTRPLTAGGVPGLVYAQEAGAAPTVVYVHGGGFLVGSAFGARPMAGILSVACGAAVLVPEYRLAPENPYPAAIDDVHASFTWLAERTGAGELTIVADSSGSGLVMSVLHRLKQEGAPMPGRVVLLSPWVDMECRFLEDETESDPQSRAIRDSADMCVPTYLGSTSRTDPAVNALHDDLTGFPPMLVQVGTGDFVLRDARELVARAVDAGVDARLELYPVNTHVFHLFWSFLPQATKALERVGDYVRADLEASQTA